MKQAATFLLSIMLFACAKEPQPKPLMQCDALEQPVLFRKKPVKPQPQAAPSIILLDFDGELVSNTSWNYTGDIDCAPSGLTAEQVQAVVDSVALRFQSFPVIVTTDELVYQNGNVNKRMRCIVTQSWEWYGQVGGVAYINSFTWGDDTPCFVFSSLFNYNTKQVGDAATHEIGHTLGLRHQAKYDDQCNMISEYSNGNGITAPIMGLPYYAYPKWWTGPVPYGCTIIQNDSLTIAQTLR